MNEESLKKLLHMVESRDPEMNILAAKMIKTQIHCKEDYNDVRIFIIKNSSVKNDAFVWRTLIYLKEELYGP